MPDLSNKVALVTGAARGIGRAVALELARGGADIVAVDLDTEYDIPALEETARDIRTLERQVFTWACDLKVSANVDRLFQAALGHFGRVDILVNNAGGAIGPDPVHNPTQLGKDILDCDDDYTQFFITANFLTCFYCCRAYVRHYRQAGVKSGAIVNLSSMGALRGGDTGPAYPASKGAVLSLTMYLARKLGPEGVRVNAVLPGIVRTRQFDKYPKELVDELTGRFIPLRRIAETDDVAPVVAFLASDEARFLTGQGIQVNGGFFG
ncbi:MAG: SDR family NAD(P)-dependent oxidoreductase [Dehalococcoidia bacterium]